MIYLPVPLGESPSDLMTLREVMKYPNIKEVYILELDPAVVETCEKAFKINNWRGKNKC